LSNQSVELPPLVEARMRTRISDVELERKVGKFLTPSDVNIQLVGPSRILRPDGSPLAIYLPGAIPVALRDTVYPVLHTLKNEMTENRGVASGGSRFQDGKRNRGTVQVASAIVGSFEGNSDGGRSFCRLTAWTGRNWPHWQATWPLFQTISDYFAKAVPDRFANQVARVRETKPEWVIQGTPFTTITVNNTWATAVHTDKGDLEEGYSCLAVLRRGHFSGGELCFPRFRVKVDLQDGDLLLMDAHEWHGNIPLANVGPETGDDHYGKLSASERISVVCYYRTEMTNCDTAEAELTKARAWEAQRLERRNKPIQ